MVAQRPRRDRARGVTPETSAEHLKRPMQTKPFDAVLVVSFGGPQGMDDIRPFLANVLRGRRVSPERVEEVAHHYEHFRGVSPITELTLRQARGLAERLRRFGPELPVYVGMRNWRPYLADTLAEMSAAGVRRAVGFVTAAQKTYSSCGQYKHNVADARAELARRGLPDVQVTFVPDWHVHEGFVAANAAHVAAALRGLPEALRGEATVVFTAHSIPTSMAAESVYREHFEASARAVMGLLRLPNAWALAYQSRRGRPEAWSKVRSMSSRRSASSRWGIGAATLTRRGRRATGLKWRGRRRARWRRRRRRGAPGARGPRRCAAAGRARGGG